MVDLKHFGIAILFTQIGSAVMVTTNPNEDAAGFFAWLFLTFGFVAYLLIICLPILCLACSIYCSVLVVMRMNKNKAGGTSSNTSGKSSGKDSDKKSPV